MEPTAQQIQELRNNFFQKLDAFDDPDKIHPADISRIKNNDDWLKRFLLHTEIDFKESLDLLWDACIWRSSFGTNEISENNVRKDFLEEGIIFPHNKDKDGRTLLILKCKNFIKGQRDMDEVKRCVVYWFERLERSEKGQPISLFFDMSDAGLSNLDMELIKYLITLFKLYYPFFLNYIFIFELPWILNAAFKVIKTWLPAKAIQKLKVINKNTLKDFVSSDQALKSWGGTDDYTFQFISEQRMAMSFDDNRKKVHFAEGSPSGDTFPQGFGDIKEEVSNSLLHIHPEDAINFVMEANELSGVTNLINMSNLTLAFKIKTTAPEKYWVRPSTGILAPKASTGIKVVVHDGFHSAPLTKDRFLIMHSVIDSEVSSQQLSEFWKQISPELIKQNKLKCIKGASNQGILRNGSALDTLDDVNVKKILTRIMKEVSVLKEDNMKLQSQVKLNTKINILILLIILLFGYLMAYLIIYELKNFEDKSCLLSET